MSEPIPMPTPIPAPLIPSRSRITIVEKVYFQSPDNPPRFVGDSYVFSTNEGGEEPWSRSQLIGEEWERLDLGWLATKDISVIYLGNMAGKGLTAIPSPDEIKQRDEQIIEVSLYPTGPAFAKIRPGRTMRWEPPFGLPVFRVRSRSGKIKLAVAAFPS